MNHIVVVGAGQAGLSLVAKLRASGYSGALTLFGDEMDPPYQRPPLSKAYLMGEMVRERLYLRPEAFYAEAGIDLRLGTLVTAIDRAAQQVRAGDDSVAYDALVLASGAVPRRLPDSIGGALDGVLTMRTLGDADAMAPLVREGGRALIVGGGYIGLEAAAVCRKKGMDVTLVEMAPRILQRVACPETSEYFRALHRAQGVDLREATGLTRLIGPDRVRGAELTDGTELACDLVVVGIGVDPADSLARAAGLAVENGIAVDELGRTSDPAIWAAGDCAAFPHGSGRLRLESVQNAIDHAEAVAGNLLGEGAPYIPKPWFWSDQYDTKLQIAGLGTGYDRIVVRPGAQAESRSHWYFAGDRLLSVDAMNDPRAYMIGKRLIDAGRSAPPEAVADPAQDLKALLAA